MPIVKWEGPLPSTSRTVPIFQVGQVLSGAERRGVDAGEMLARAQIPAALLGAPLSRVSIDQFTRLSRVLRRELRDDFFGLTAKPVPLGTFAYLCRRLVECRTLRQALREGFRFLHMLVDDFVLRLAVRRGVAQVRLVHRGPPGDDGIYGQRAVLFFSLVLASWLVARRVPLARVHYRPSEIGRDAYLQVLYQAHLDYGMAPIGYDFDARWLDLPIVQNTMSLRDFLRASPAELLAQYRDRTSLIERINRLLRRNLREELPTLEAVAVTFGMTAQTLRRKLRAEGHTYQSLKDELRRDAAVELLVRSDLTLAEIAVSLGFSELSTFHRAFKKWTGLPPGEYRSRRAGPLEGALDAAPGAQETPADDFAKPD